MATVTEAIDNYNAGRSTFEQLLDDLSSRTYAVPDDIRARAGMTQAELYFAAEEQDTYQAGTWGEVLLAYDMGKLTSTEYYAIDAEFDRRLAMLPEV
jgi:hypothetical protein